METKPLVKHVTVYLSADSNSIPGYFNRHDPTPVYARQLSHEFEEYLNNCIVKASRYSVVNYKVVCNSKIDTLF